jgi:hypothetical protein
MPSASAYKTVTFLDIDELDTRLLVTYIVGSLNRCPLSQNFCSPTEELAALFGVTDIPVIDDFEFSILVDKGGDGESVVVELGAVCHIEYGGHLCRRQR